MGCQRGAGPDNAQRAKSGVFVQWVYYQIFSQIYQKYFLVQKNILSKQSDLDPREEKDGSESNNLPVNEDKSKTPTKSNVKRNRRVRRDPRKEKAGKSGG